MSNEEAKVPEIDKPLTKEFGTLTFYHADNTIPECHCDRLAVSGEVLAAASFVTTPTQMKGIRAILYAKKGRVEIRASDLTVQYPSRSMDTYYSRSAAPRCFETKLDTTSGLNVWTSARSTPRSSAKTRG